MEKQKNTRLIVYRQGEKGLEVLLLRSTEQGAWELPTALALERLPQQQEATTNHLIELDPVEETEEGIFEQAYAVESDWHEIPSLKDILRHDLRYVKDTLKQMVPDMMQRGVYVSIKDAFKKVLPHQYKMLKELKDILTDRNLTKYL